ncbi:tubulin monoglutamylase TTLL4 isoform X1 [Gopherus flavomarginatus]|uniref:tubulin monoglutamylase TTLL4 isoform X1 n=1 Tax=Gopherus flavomarginatus TaxID=286002 RepID=UPI0021CC29C5|nr:tubulin monoglutamylase TTLL4 isoform X1 [Gopherus flavomarginatus]
MASAGPEHYSIGLKKGSNFQLPVPAAERPLKSQAWVLAQQQVKPIWKLGRKHVSTFQDHRPLHSGIPPQRACFLYPVSLCSSRLSDRSLPLSRSPPPPFPDLAGSTLLYRRSYFRHKPYQRLESICLRSSALESRQLPFPPRGLQADHGMASSAVEPFPRPSAAGEQAGAGGKCTPLGSGKQTSGQYKPVLNNNSFLRPNSAKVPSLQSPENKKLKNAPKSPAISWSHCGGTGDDSSMSLENRSGKGNGLVLEQTTPVSRLSPVQPNAAFRAEQSSWHLEDSESRVQTLKAKEREIRLTEAVRKLSGKVTYNEFGRRIETSCLMNTGFQYNLFNRNSHWKQHLLAQLSPRETAAPLNLELGNQCLSSNLSLAGPNSAAICTKRISVRLLASNSDSWDPSAPCRTVNFLGMSSGDPVGKTEPAHHADISAVAAQMSTIQLSKDAKWEQATPLREPEATVNLPLLNPGEPEADAEEELPDGLEDGCSQDEEEEEGESDSSSVTGLSPNGSVALISRNYLECLTQPLEARERILKPALICSLFPTVPPTIYFSTRDEKVEKLPWEQRKLLRWKMSTVTPNIVKQTIGRSHFKVSKKNSDWLGCWGHHMKSPGFRAIKEHQKLNHFPGSFQIGRKDRLWRNLSKMQARFGKKEFNFFPQSFILPQDIKLLRKAWEESGSRQKWIVKPPASARGIGIQVIHKWSQLPKRRPLLVQRYLHKPYLIGGCKFDLRIYVYVTCYDPLRIYLFRDGLVRFASCKYSSSMKSLSNKFMHLTNYSVNKKNAEYKSNSDETACLGHKWALKALWGYLSQKGVNSEAIWEKIKDIVIKTIIASEPYVNSLVKMYVRRPSCCHELFGFDVMLDENLKPWILEVNISPSLHSSSPLDVSIKGQMIRDLLNLAGFVLPNVDDVASGSGSASSSTISLTSTTKEKPKSAPEQFTAEKMKRAYYLTQKLPDQDFYSSVLDILTPDDVRVLVETEDEFARRGQFERVFPTRISMRYLRFFEQPRYFNILTAQWELKYYLNKPRGLDLLRNWCHKGFLSGAVPDLAQTWSLPRPHLFPKSDGHLNGFCKLELGRFGKPPLPRDAEEVPTLLEPSTCPQSFPLIRYSGGAIKKPVIPQTCSRLSDSALVM